MLRRTLAVLLFAPAALAAQAGGISGVIVSRATGEPLPYGIVELEGQSRSMFANDSGQFEFRELQPGHYVVRVKRLGFAPVDRVVAVAPGAVETVRFELDRIAVSLGAITVKAWPPCTSPGHPTDSALSLIVQQIRLNAEQYRWMSTEYPFQFDVIIKRTARLRRNGMVVPEPGSMDRIESKAASRGYKPGEVIYRSGGAIVWSVPTLAEVADKRFVENHCWHYGGVESIEDEGVFRVDVVAFDSLKGADMNGSFYIDTLTFHIRRSILNLSKRSSLLKDLADFQTTTDFFEVMSSISIPSRVYATQTFDPKVRGRFSEAFEEQRTINFKFLGRRPGETKP